ncbi:DUF2142 domain-containing protein [Plantibacter sp. Mn2098]|uniref:DUF2142 domain-containing protein n=1 Tax=Plantibacter sp. Mn2098 TaxID=3395266 RepID=UPI003BEAD6E9
MLIVSFLATLAPMLIWAVGSPLMAVPDEPSHAIRAAAVVRGQLGRTPHSEQPTQSEALVPASIAAAHALPCFAFRPEVSAGCQVPLQGDPQRNVTTGTTAGLNSPVYYAIVGLPSLLFHGETAFIAMRALNSVLCAALLAVMFVQLRRLPRSRWAVMCAAVAVTPMLLSLGGSINPNGVEAAAAGAFFATLLASLRTASPGRRLWHQGCISVVAMTFLVSGRSIGLLWAVLIIGTALLLADRRVLRDVLARPAAWVSAGTAATVGTVTVVWFGNPPQFAAEPTASAADPITWLFIAAVTLVRTADYSAGLIGLFGWGTVPLPAFTGAAWAAVVLALLATASYVAAGLARRVLFGAIAVMVVVPPFIQASAYAEYGFIWQGRYLLAPFLCTLLIAGYAIDRSERIAFTAPVQRLVLTAAVLLCIGQILAFIAMTIRFVVGSTGSPIDLILAPQWHPPVHWAALTIALAAASAAGWFAVVRSAARATTDEIDGAVLPHQGGRRR